MGRGSNMWRGKIWLKGKWYPVDAPDVSKAKDRIVSQYMEEHPEDTMPRPGIKALCHVQKDRELDGRVKYL